VFRGPRIPISWRRLALVLVLFSSPSWASEKLAGSGQSFEQSTRPDQRALVGGALLFGVSYGLACAAAAHDSFGDESDWLGVPLAGPWIVMSHGDASGGALALDGIAQVGGVALVAGSFMFPERTLGPARAELPTLRLRVGRASSDVMLGMRF
jgi:hypothetical protein